MKTKVQTGSLLGLFGLLIGFQNCDHASFKGSAPSKEDSVQGNGEPYTGKPTGYYLNFDTANPCSDLDLNGKPLPNAEIQIKSASLAYLVRRECSDLAPKTIDSSSLDISGPGLMLGGNTFLQPTVINDFALVQAQCPAGTLPNAGAARSNLFRDSQNWTTKNWYIHPGISVSPLGTLSSLPLFQVQRSDSTLLDQWRRASQILNVKGNTRYALTFAATPGSTSVAAFKYTRDSESLQVEFDLQNGTSKVDWAVNVTNVTSTVRPFGTGYIGTVYFTTPTISNLDAADIGVTPAPLDPQGPNGQLNDSIFATAAQLETVDSFCH